MNNAIYAIPGLMPPTAPNFHSKLVAPEDGSLCICVHCGPATDKVKYAIRIPGHMAGVIKDPSYNYGKLPARMTEAVKRYLDAMPQFMTVSTTLSPDAMVPRMRIGDCPIPITERPDVCAPCYWILNLPKRTLPFGDSVVEVTVNGRLHSYIVQRQTFAIHALPDITPRLAEHQMVHGEKLNVSFLEMTQGVINVDLSDLFGIPDLTGAEFTASMFANGATTPLAVVPNGDILTLYIPAMEACKGSWTAFYKLPDREEWVGLIAGQIIIVPAPNKACFEVVLPNTGGQFEILLLDCYEDANLFEGAEYEAEVIVEGQSYLCATELMDETHLAVIVPAIPAGEGLWSVRYKLFDEWLDLSAGTIKIEET